MIAQERRLAEIPAMVTGADFRQELNRGKRKKSGRESVGHHSGRRIVDILGKNMTDLTDNDVEWMHKVVG
jgi:hypothetical protein